MREKRFGLLGMILSVLITLLLTLGAVVLAAWVFIGPAGLTLLEGLTLVNTRFVGEYEQTQVVDAAMSGMVAGLGDRWSYYLTPEEYAATNERRKNTYVGVGITISYEDPRGLLITQVLPESSAGKAGLQAGDVITHVAGSQITPDNQNEMVDLIRGEAGTEVELTYLRAGGGSVTTSLLRQEMETKPVEYSLLADKTGYVQIKNFYNRSAQDMKAAVEDLQKQGATRLVFDLRNNGGGYLSELTDMLDFLLPEGPIFRSQSRNGAEVVTNSDAACVDLPMAVLVNQNTYSAAEFFAAELREQGAGLIVGEQTSGKGYSQQTFALPGGGGMGISTAAYYTGAGESLIGKGLTLDREISLSEADAARFQAGTLPPAEDGQLQAAVALLIR
ncbi:MAG: S41 family peptidase [Pseudoflavonifractor sp.]